LALSFYLLTWDEREIDTYKGLVREKDRVGVGMQTEKQRKRDSLEIREK